MRVWFRFSSTGVYGKSCHLPRPPFLSYQNGCQMKAKWLLLPMRDVFSDFTPKDCSASRCIPDLHVCVCVCVCACACVYVCVCVQACVYCRLTKEHLQSLLFSIFSFFPLLSPRKLGRKRCIWTEVDIQRHTHTYTHMPTKKASVRNNS